MNISLLNLFFFSKENSLLSGAFADFSIRQYMCFKWSNSKLTENIKKLIVTPVAFTPR